MKLFVPIIAAVVGLAASFGNSDAVAGHSGVRVKDCTPYNGRFGYYGNPWCSAAEQLRWERREARRVRVVR